MEDVFDGEGEDGGLEGLAVGGHLEDVGEVAPVGLDVEPLVREVVAPECPATPTCCSAPDPVTVVEEEEEEEDMKGSAGGWRKMWKENRMWKRDTIAS